MKLGRETIVGAVSALVVVGLIAWAWSWFVSKPGSEAIALTDSSPAGIQTAPPPGGITVNQKPSDDWTAMGVARATRYAGGPPKMIPDTPEPPLAPEQLICPTFQVVSINRDRPDKCSNEELVARSTEIFGLLKFDIARLPEPPRKAVLRAHVSYIENTHGYQTPLKLAFYRLKTAWDDSATFRYASSRDQVEWKSGTSFNHASPADVDLNPVATLVIPNPCKPGFNLEADITSLVTAWQKGEYPNHGLLLFRANSSTPPWAVQGNLTTRKYTTMYAPQILCTLSAPVKASTERGPETQPGAGSTGFLKQVRSIFDPK